MESKELNQKFKFETEETKGEIKQVFFRDYGSTKYYYKASIIYNTALPSVSICRSYNTNIALYDSITQTFFVNKDFYDCSITTKKHYNHYTHKTVPTTAKTIYLYDADFKQITKAFYNTDTNTLKSSIIFYNELYKHDKEIIDTLTAPITTKEKLEHLKNKIKYVSDETTPLKTVTKHRLRHLSGNIEFYISFSTNKNGKRTTQERITITNAGVYYNDN